VTDPNVYIFVPLGTWQVDELVSYLNQRIREHTSYLTFVYKNHSFVKLIFKNPKTGGISYTDAFTFKIFQMAVPTIEHRLSPGGGTFSIKSGSFDLKYTGNTTKKINGDDCEVGFEAQFMADANGFYHDAFASTFPVFMKVASQVFEITGIVNNTTLRTRNAARHDIAGSAFLRSAFALKNVKIMIPSKQETVKECLRKFSISYGSILPALGFTAHEACDINLCGHLTRSDYINFFLGFDSRHAVFPNSFNNVGRFANTTRERFVSSDAIYKNSNPSGSTELFTVTHINNPANAGRIDMIRVSADKKPLIVPYADSEEHAFVLNVNAVNGLEFERDNKIPVVENEREISLKKKSATSGIAILLQNKFGMETIFTSHPASNWPALIRFTIRDQQGERVRHPITARIGLRVHYSLKN